MPNLRERFDTALAELGAAAGWEMARVQRPILALGSLDGVQTGVRQLRRSRPFETTVMRVGEHDVTLPEVLRIEACLCGHPQRYARLSRLGRTDLAHGN
jgi:hypothetical protein